MIPYRETDVQPGQVDAGAELPLIALPGGVTASRFHLPVVANTGAERQMERAQAMVNAAVAPQTPTRTPNPFTAVQARLVLTYDEPRTSVWGRASQ